jgi:hypothetical protein
MTMNGKLKEVACPNVLNKGNFVKRAKQLAQARYASVEEYKKARVQMQAKTSAKNLETAGKKSLREKAPKAPMYAALQKANQER